MSRLENTTFFLNLLDHRNNEQRFYATTRAAAANSSWRNKAAIATMATLGFGIWGSKQVLNSIQIP